MATQKQKDTRQKKKKTNAGETGPTFPCGDFERMAEIMRKYCEDPGQMFQCCSMMAECMEEKTKEE